MGSRIINRLSIDTTSPFFLLFHRYPRTPIFTPLCGSLPPPLEFILPRCGKDRKCCGRPVSQELKYKLSWIPSSLLLRSKEGIPNNLRLKKIPVNAWPSHPSHLSFIARLHGEDRSVLTRANLMFHFSEVPKIVASGFSPSPTCLCICCTASHGHIYNSVNIEHGPHDKENARRKDKEEQRQNKAGQQHRLAQLWKRF